jgi:5-methylcytosine-specific restriction enzyme A
MPVAPPRHRPQGWHPSVKRTDPFYRSSEWYAVRRHVMQRDRGICRVCGRPGANLVHHIIERKDGGSDDPSNLASVHRACHGKLHPSKGGAHG